MKLGDAGGDENGDLFETMLQDFDGASGSRAEPLLFLTKSGRAPKAMLARERGVKAECSLDISDILVH